MATVVVLNGTSSSGKTTLAQAFQDLAETPFLNVSIDTILYTLPRKAIDQLIAGVAIANLPYRALDAAFYACVRELAALGLDLVIDNAVISRGQAERLVAAVDGHRVLMVAVSSPAEVLERRERHRGDRHPGLGVRQLETISSWLDYDLEIDTSLLTPYEAGAQLVAALTAEKRGALERTRARLSSPEAG
jgi:chloramphenicol 3-O phosphotransferase